MSARFTYFATPERAWQRKVRLAVETIDAVTLEPVWEGVTVTAEGMKAEPVISAGGRFVWFDEKGANPTAVNIDPGRLPYLARREIPPAPPLPPAAQVSLLRVELAPTPAYLFAPGTSGVRGTLIDKRLDDPAVPLSDVPVNLQWIDDDRVGTNWVDVPIRSITNEHGDFVAILRLTPDRNARMDAQQRLRVRVAATRSGSTQFSPELPIRPGYVADVQPSFAWDEFQNV
jgi:hypothetical protein